MNTRITSSLLAVLLTFAIVAESRAQNSAFTYQGRLSSGGTPANGRHDFQFTLFALESGGSPSSAPVVLSAVGVTNGLFTVALDFGADAFTGTDRWLDIAVRPAGGSTFTPLTPRQPIMPTPYALTALKVPGISGSSLHSANGGPPNVVVVDNLGKVGVGTTAPASQFHVASKANELPPRLQSAGNADFSAGWDFYHGATGKGYIGVPDPSAPLAPGELVLFGGPSTQVSLWPGQSRALTVNTSGNVGIGTDSPNAKLDVRGDISMGAGGQLKATSSEENLRIVRGVINSAGAVIAGVGFTVSKGSSGRYAVAFDTPFASAPTVTATAHYGGQGKRDVMTDGVTAGLVNFVVHRTDELGTFNDQTFSFIAIGPR